jgi:hypothetical protein
MSQEQLLTPCFSSRTPDFSDYEITPLLFGGLTRGPHLFSFSPDGLRLQIKGVSVDVVVKTTCTFHRRFPIDLPLVPEIPEISLSMCEWVQNLRSWAEVASTCALVLAKQYRGQPLCDILTQNYTCYFSNRGEKGWEEIHEEFKCFLDILLMSNSENLEAKIKDISEANPGIKKWLNPESISELNGNLDWKIFVLMIHTPGAKEFLDHLNNFLRGYSVFLTTDKRLGLSIANISEGDLVVLCSGLKFPLILRKHENDNEYRLRCPAYISGIMEGEAFPEDIQEHDLEIFVLV